MFPGHFDDDLSSWANNCAANNATNGVDGRIGSNTKRAQKLQPIAALKQQPIDINLPDPFLPTLPPSNGSEGVIKSFILPGNKTGVVRPQYLWQSFTYSFVIDVRWLVRRRL